jgi:hypothetical protein
LVLLSEPHLSLPIPRGVVLVKKNNLTGSGQAEKGLETIDYGMKHRTVGQECKNNITGRKIGRSGVPITSIRNLESGSSKVRMILELNV